VSDAADAVLVRRSLSGSHEAYRELVTRYQGHVYGLAYSLVGHWADAQDIAQETFIRAYSNLDQLREPERFAAWLRRVTFSVAMNWLKAFRPKLFGRLDGRVDPDRLEIPDFRPGPVETLEKRDLADAVLRAVAGLPPKYRVPLTMFHLDGLSYEKVAGFLDIPLGTAKSLIHRARRKLKAALGAAIGEEITPMVQEVFDEHKLPEEFARRVLDNVPPVSYRQTDCTYAAALTSAMQYLGEDVSYEYVMGVSGGAFRLLWHGPWCPSIGCLQVFGEKVIRTPMACLGYAWEGRIRTGAEGERETFRRLIVESIDRGRPVLVEGIIGPPEYGVVTGYERRGEVLLGWSFFRDAAKGYYRRDDWYDDAGSDAGCTGVIVVGEKVGAPPARDVLRMALELAVDLAHTPAVRGALQGVDYVAGLAAYDAWAEGLLDDASFPRGDLEVLTFKCHVGASVGLCNLLDSRRAAAAFLRQMADAAGPAAERVQAAADLYETEAALARTIADVAPSSMDSEEKRLTMADPALRREVSGKLLEARDIDAQAVAHLEQALATY